MELFDNPMFLRKLIMDHYQNPRNKRRGDNGYVCVNKRTESCIDDLMLFAKIENGILVDVCFDGEACTIATASASMMTELLKGKTIEEAHQIMNEFDKMVELQDFDHDTLQEAVAFKNVGKQASRIRCATLGWRGIEEVIEGSETVE